MAGLNNFEGGGSRGGKNTPSRRLERKNEFRTGGTEPVSSDVDNGLLTNDFYLEALKSPVLGEFDVDADGRVNSQKLISSLPAGFDISDRIVNAGNIDEIMVFRITFPDPKKPGVRRSTLIDFDIKDLVKRNNGQLPAGKMKLHGRARISDAMADIAWGREGLAKVTISNNGQQTTLDMINLQNGVNWHYLNSSVPGQTIEIGLDKSGHDPRKLEFDTSVIYDHFGGKDGTYTIMGRTK